MNEPTGGSGRPHGPVDVVVVNFNAARDLGDCVVSLLSEPVGTVGTIVVVDNASQDDSEAVVRALSQRDGGVIWLPTGRNLGFGSGANRGVAATTSAYVLLINPDATVIPGAVGSMADALDADPELGVVGPEVLNTDGTRYPSARAFPDMLDAMGHGAFGLIVPRNRWSERYRSPDRIDWVSGTAMLLRRSALEAIGGFDESYFMYVEDVDLCWRMTAAGWRVGYLTDASVSHRIGGSSEQRPYRMVLAHHRSLWRFAVATTSGARRLALPVVAVGLFGRSLLASIARFARKRPPAAQ